jgi:hypothetical protein
MIINNFINQYFEDGEIFYIFFLNRNTNATQQRYCDLKYFNKNYQDLWSEWNKKEVDIYFSLNNFKWIDKKISRKKRNVKDIKTLFFDIDIDAETIKPLIIKELGKPTYVIQTSQNKYQLLYVLENTDIDFNDFETISKTLTYHFKTDKTFDISRVSRLPNNINNKNGFMVNYEYNHIKYDIKHFQDYINLNNIILEETIKDKSFKTSNKVIAEKHKQKEKINIETNPTNQSNIKKKFNKNLIDYDFVYQDLLSQNNNDYSAADFDFVVFLIKFRKLKKTTTIQKHFLNHCVNVETRHNDLHNYFNQIINKIT